MSNLRAPIAAAALLAALGGVSCAVGVGPGYDSGYVGVGYAGDYYDPCCYGGEGWGWGGRYHVGPPPGGGRYGGGPRPGGPGPGGGGHGGGGRPAPSIPGGHGGGGGHPR
jgi:translation initiation factor IF-2